MIPTEHCRTATLPQLGSREPWEHTTLAITRIVMQATKYLLSSAQFSRSVVFNSLWSHEPQHARPPGPSPSPRVYPNPCPLSWCHPLLFLPSIFPSIRVFANESALCVRWPKYWSFSFNISPSNEHPGLISSRMNWLDLLAVQGTLKSLLQHHSSKASILQLSASFIVQLSHPYMTTGKSIPLTKRLWCCERLRAKEEGGGGGWDS